MNAEEFDKRINNILDSLKCIRVIPICDWDLENIIRQLESIELTDDYVKTKLAFIGHYIHKLIIDPKEEGEWSTLKPLILSDLNSLINDLFKSEIN